MDDLSLLAQDIELYRSTLSRGLVLKISTSGESLSVRFTDEPIRYWRNVGRTSFGLMLLAMALPFLLSIFGLDIVLSSVVGLVLVIACAVPLLVSVLVLRTDMRPFRIDLREQLLYQGETRWPLSRVERIVVRRNLHNERYRLGVVDHLKDEDLLGITVFLVVSFWRRVPCAQFRSTAVAMKFAHELGAVLCPGQEVTLI